MSSASSQSPETLIRQSQGIVRNLASRIHLSLPTSIELDDLISYGQVGLAQAAKDFDPEKGARFATYAYYRIRGAIYDGLSKMSWMSRARYNRIRCQLMADEVMETDADETSQQDSQPSMEDEARWLAKVTERLAIVYLASNRDEDEEGSSSAIEDVDEPAPPTVVAGREVSEILHKLVDSLPEDAGSLIRATYFEGMTLQDAARQLGVSKSWASRLHAKTLDQLGRSLTQLGAEN